MTRTTQALAAFGFVLVGVWGCSQPDSVSVKTLENRIAKLEEDLKSTAGTRDALRVKLAALEEQVRAEGERAKLIEQERDLLTAQLRQKTAERETVVAQYDDLVKKLETVLGHAKVAQMQQNGGTVRATVTSRPK